MKPNPGSTPIFRLTYVSEANDDLASEEMESLAHTANANNTRLNITGVLIRCAGEYLQVLEGDHDQVLRLYERIRRDPRHVNVSIVSTEFCAEPVFKDWAMGCFNFTREEHLPDGFFFRESEGRHRLHPDALDRAGDVLAVFYRNNREAGMDAAFVDLEPA